LPTLQPDIAEKTEQIAYEESIVII
jgi:hypothetical protein